MKENDVEPTTIAVNSITNSNNTKTHHKHNNKTFKYPYTSNKDIMSKPFLHSLILVFIGILIAFVSQSRNLLTTSLFDSFDVSNNIRYLVYAFMFLLLFLLSSIHNKFKYKPPKLIYFVISILYVINVWIYAYGYTRNHIQFPCFEYMWSVVFSILIYTSFHVYKRTHDQLTLLILLSFLIFILSTLLQVVCGYYEKDSMFKSVYSIKDNANNALCVVNSIIFTCIYFLYDYAVESIDQLWDAFPYIGGSVFCVLLLMGVVEEYEDIPGLLRLEWKFVVSYFGITCVGAFLLIIKPFYVKKCTTVFVCVCASMEMFICLVCYCVFPLEILEQNQKRIDNFGLYISFGGFIAGLLLFNYERRRKDITNVKTNTNVVDVDVLTDKLNK